MNTSSLVRLLALAVLLLLTPLARAAEPTVIGPSTPFPASSILSDQKPGSVLVYNFYQSDTARSDVDTEISITNVSDVNPAFVHLFYVRSNDCSIADRFLCLAANQTVSFLASDFDPDTTGYLVAVAVDATTGVPVSNNTLIGSEYIKLATGHQGKLNAISIAALYAGTLPGYTSGPATLLFDGIVYNQLPRTVALDSIPSRLDGYNTLLVVNRIGGDFTGGGVASIGTLAGQVFDDNENSTSFTRAVNSCQLQATLGANNFPASTFDTIIPASRTGWMKFYDSTGDNGLLGAALDANPNAASFTGARNLKTLTLATSVSLVVPVLAPPQNCPLPSGPRVDLALTKTVSPSGYALPGSFLTYTLTSRNQSTTVVNSLTIRDQLPANTTFISATPSAGGTCTPAPPVGGPVAITCTFPGPIAFGGERSVIISAQVNPGAPIGSNITNTGVTYSPLADSNFSNNTRTVYSPVVSTPPLGSGLVYYPLAQPVRLLDTRPGFAACDALGVVLPANTERPTLVRGTCGIPANAVALVGNATIVTPDTDGYATLWPTGQPIPTVSNLNFVAGQIVPNSFTVALGTDGQFSIQSTANTHFLVDVAGYYAPPGQGGLYFHPLPNPVRLLDTRPGALACDAPGAPLTANVARGELARGTCGIPASALVVVGNATAVNTLPGSTGGYAQLWPSGQPIPGSSNLNFVPGQIVPNSFTVALGADGKFNVQSTATTHFIVDIAGYYDGNPNADANGIVGLTFTPLSSPVRLLDTRAGFSACANPGAPLAGGTTRTQTVRLACTGIPSSALAVTGNATVVSAFGQAGYATLWPSDAAQPTVSNLNYVAGQIVPNAFTVGLGAANGDFNIFVTGTTHFIVDLSGYFAPQ